MSPGAIKPLPPPRHVAEVDPRIRAPIPPVPPPAEVRGVRYCPVCRQTEILDGKRRCQDCNRAALSVAWSARDSSKKVHKDLYPNHQPAVLATARRRHPAT